MIHSKFEVTMPSVIGLFLGICAVYISCTGKLNSEDQLLGTWTLAFEELADCKEPPDNYHQNIPCSDSTCFKITFLHKGKMKVDVTMDGNTNSWNQTYSVKGNKISICDSTGCKDQGTFIISDSKLTLSDSSEHGCIRKEFYKKLSTE